MKVLHVPSRDKVALERKRQYLEKWPIEKQLEAYAEAAAGRPEKQSKMLKEFAEIRKLLPFYPKKEDDNQCQKA